MTPPETEHRLGKDLKDLTWEEYNKLVAEMIRNYYDVIVASVFDKCFASGHDADNETRREGMFNLIRQFEKMEKDNYGLHLIKHEKNFQDKKTNIILTLEGGSHSIEEVN